MTPEGFSEVVNANPSLRGMIVGYIAEKKLRDLFHSSGKTSALRKDDDHARDKKGDLVVTYMGEEFRIEVKSLQTNTVQVQASDGQWLPLMNKVAVGRKPSPGLKKNGKLKLGAQLYKWVENPVVATMTQAERQAASYRGSFQCDASDQRKIYLDGGEKVATTLLKVGEFDIVAAGLFSFREQWEFGFALNHELPRSTDRRYTAAIQEQLIASLIPVSLPLQHPFVSDPFTLLERLLDKRPKR